MNTATIATSSGRRHRRPCKKVTLFRRRRNYGGAAAQAVKAVAEVRGWPHNNHRDLYNVIGRLRQETGQGQLSVLFAVASALHQNFYEWWMSLDEVRELSPRVQELREAQQT